MGSCAAALLLLTAWTPAADAASMLRPDKWAVLTAEVIALATVTEATVEEKACARVTRATLAVKTFLKGKREGLDALPYMLELPAGDKCPVVPEAPPPHAPKIEKGLSILVVLRCPAGSACAVVMTSAKKDAGLVRAWLKSYRARKKGVPACVRAAPTAGEVLELKRGAKGTTPSGLTVKFAGAGHKIHGPGFVELNFRHGDRKGGARAYSDDWEQWQKTLGYCWRMSEHRGFDTSWLELEAFPLPVK